MKPLVKICGITNLADALACCHAGADALGFIFYRQSARSIEIRDAAMIITHLPDRITPVGVFVNASRESIVRVIRETGIRTVQLSGDEAPDECSGYPIPVWKAFRIRDIGQVDSVRHYAVAAALLDGAGEGRYGGTGQAPDFSIARSMKRYHRLILAGGLDPSNVADAVRTVRPYAVDVNSGVELTEGKKDHEAVKALIEQVHYSSPSSSRDLPCSSS